MKRTVFVGLIILMSINVFAQDEAKSFIIGYSPISNLKVEMDHSDEKYTYSYESLYDFSLGFETQSHGITHLVQISMLEGVMYEQKLKGETQWFDMNSKDNIKNYMASYYAGRTFNSGKRFQFPVYLGLSLGYNGCGQFDQFVFYFGGKVRAKFYLTNSIGLFVGYNRNYGGGVLKGKSENGDSYEYKINEVISSVDGGVVISF